MKEQRAKHPSFWSGLLVGAALIGAIGFMLFIYPPEKTHHER